MKKLFLLLALLRGITVQAQEVGTPAYYAKCFEDLFVAGFVVGLEESEEGAEGYFKTATAFVDTTPVQILHQTFVNNVAHIDPMSVYKQVHSPEEFLDFIVGEQSDFGLSFVIGGYMAAARAIDMENYLIRKYTENGIRMRCKYIYDMLVAAAVQKIEENR